MGVRFYNARVLSMADGEEIYSGEVHVEGNRIVYAGFQKCPYAFSDDVSSFLCRRFAAAKVAL